MASPAMQRDVQAQLAVLGDRLYKAIRTEQVMPGDSPAKRPDLAHWKTVLVRVSRRRACPSSTQLPSTLVPLLMRRLGREPDAWQKCRTPTKLEEKALAGGGRPDRAAEGGSAHRAE